MTRYCKACARPLKEKRVIKRGEVGTVWVCKSPICRLYNKPTRGGAA